MTRGRALAALVAVLTALIPVALAAGASARALPGLTIGFQNDPVLTGGTAAARAVWTQRAVSEGAGIVRVNLYWRQIAPATRPAGFVASDPASPGYDWAPTDTAVRSLAASGMQVVLTILLAPNWATGPNAPASVEPGTWKPSPSALAAFATAAATRYSGRFPDPENPGRLLPRVRYWQGWNEPNLAYDLTPQWTRTAHGYTPASPAIYRGMANAFYAAIKAVARTDFVLMAGTSPYGDPPGGPRMQPVAFDRGVFCQSVRLSPVSCPDPIHVDALDHHPYDIGSPLHAAVNADDATVPDIGKITKVVSAAERSRRVLPAGAKPVWVTEVSWDTNPADVGGVSVATQAQWLEQAMYVLWRQGVGTVFWLRIADAPTSPGPGSIGDPYRAGVYYADGRPKPSATAFRFPFVTTRLDRARIQAWGRAPAGGRLTIELRRSGRWRVMARVSVKARQVFSTTLPLSGTVALRARVAGSTSLTWTQAK